MTKQAMTEPDTSEFHFTGGLISHGRAVTFNTSGSFFIAVEKYLPDNATLSAKRITHVSYFADNKIITNDGFSFNM